MEKKDSKFDSKKDNAILYMIKYKRIMIALVKIFIY
jgi:hypothetical protein